MIILIKINIRASYTLKSNKLFIFNILNKLVSVDDNLENCSVWVY